MGASRKAPTPLQLLADLGLQLASGLPAKRVAPVTPTTRLAPAPALYLASPVPPPVTPIVQQGTTPPAPVLQQGTPAPPPILRQGEPLAVGPLPLLPPDLNRARSDAALLAQQKARRRRQPAGLTTLTGATYAAPAKAASLGGY